MLLHRRRRQAKRKGQEVLVQALASRFQDILQLPVLCREFYWAGKYGPCTTHPSSIVTVHPFCSGGTRRLIFNVHHPLILEIAKAHASSSRRMKNDDAMIMEQIAAVMTKTSAWPIAMDTGAKIGWKMAKGLICGPYWNFVGPVPHEECGPGRIAIWPRRIHHIKIQPDKSLVNAAGDSPVSTKVVTYLGDKWERRDEVLQAEWDAMRTKRINGAVVHLQTNEVQFITYSPSLPILLLAQALQNPPSEAGQLGNCTRVESLTIATKVLLSVDKMFCLCLFFGVPLMDRTRTWTNSVRVNHVFPPPPTVKEVIAYQERLTSKDPTGALEETMLRRARNIWSQADAANKSVTVCWSGGIDSTAVLVCLLKTAENKSRLHVVHDDESQKENPSFYGSHVKGKLRCIERAGRTLSEIAKQLGNKTLLVTGELGDQLFGSDLCFSAFAKNILPELTEQEATYIKLLEPDIAFDSLEDDWDEALLPMLDEIGLLAGGKASWLTFFAPQLQKSPIPIKTIYDLLWWLNFSCKWQNVALRCLHDGGGYRPRDSLTGSILHFYLDRELECWSCVPEYHDAKFTNLQDWKTYKQPLKEVIYRYHPDEDFRVNKLKTGSLTFPLEADRKDRVERILGLLVSKDGTTAEFKSGVISIMDLTGRDLAHLKKPDGTVVVGVEELLEPWVMNTPSSKPPVKIPTIHIDPWGSRADSAFDAASQFAADDERQRRARNPVTATTLLGKCSCLLPPDLVKGKKVLDIGACLGAMCHWSLYHGADHVVAVEPQANFCERMERLLAEASSTWPKTAKSEKRYDIVCVDAKEFLASCKDNSFDIIVVAGVLHCFQDPISILLEMVRVASCICIESVNTTYHTNGFCGDLLALSPSTGLLEMAPSAAVNKAGEDVSFTGMAVIPSESLLRDVMAALGYESLRIIMKEHPTKNEDVLTYSGNRHGHAFPIRFFLRCTRVTKNVIRMRSLEECIITGVGNEQLWSSVPAGRYWTSYDFSDHVMEDDEVVRVENKNLPAIEKQARSDELESTPGTWTFDESVAERFRSEADRHIPDYVQVVQTCLDAIAKYFGERLLPSLRVVDVGCAIGYTMLEMLDFGIGHVYGYDISESMLKAAEKNLKDALELGRTWSADNYHLFLAKAPKDVPPTPPAQFLKGGLDVVVINWTLHFILAAEDRRIYLNQLLEMLKPGGMMLMTEKTNQDDVTRELYYKWKAEPPQNVSAQIIQAKRSKLKGVLETLPVSWYLSTLDACGYENITVLRAKYGFVTFICYKPAKPVEVFSVSKPFATWEDVESSANEINFDGSGDPEPYTLSAWGANSAKTAVIEEDPSVSTFGFVQSGEALLCRTLKNGKLVNIPLVEGMYFSVAGQFQLKGGSGILSSTPSRLQPPFFTVGGPLEDQGDGSLCGRLPYIDGCTDSLLISPVVKGAPCLNHLHFPPNVTQTQHTHPSGRTGIVVRGRGICRVVHPVTKDVTSTVLQPGMVFCIPRNLPHAFETGESDSLDVVAFHPDSDFGPTPTNHPMVNRTLVDGVSASKIPMIQTAPF